MGNLVLWYRTRRSIAARNPRSPAPEDMATQQQERCAFVHSSKLRKGIAGNH